MIYATKPKAELLDYVLDNLREEDKFEMRIEFGENYKQIIKKHCLKSTHIKIIVNGNFKPVGLFGYEEVDSETAEVCLLATDELKKHFIDFLNQAKTYLLFWKKKYKKLHNYVYKHNKQAIRWLKILGFTVEDYDDMRMYFYQEGSNEHN